MYNNWGNAWQDLRGQQAGANAPARRSPLVEGSQGWDGYSEESSDQVIYQNSTKANLFSLYKNAVQPGPSRYLHLFEEDKSLQAGSDVSRPSTTLANATREGNLFQGDVHQAALQPSKDDVAQPSQPSAVAKTSVRSRRPSLDPVGSLDSPVGWDDAPQDDPKGSIQEQDAAVLPCNSPAVPDSKQAERAAPTQTADFCSSRREDERAHAGGWAQDDGQRVFDAFHFDEAPKGRVQPAPQAEARPSDGWGGAAGQLHGAGSLGLGWTQDEERPERRKGKKAERRPKFSIRPQHRPVVTRPGADAGKGPGHLLQKLKQLDEASHAVIVDKAFPEPADEDIEQEEHEEAGPPWPRHAALQEEDIDMDGDEPRSPAHTAPPSALSERPPSMGLAAPSDAHPLVGSVAASQGGAAGAKLTSQFRNALQAAPDAGDADTLGLQSTWGRKQPTGIVAQLQTAMQRHRNQELLFSKALQAGQLAERDLRSCLDVRIVSSSIDAHLIACTCEVLQEPREDDGSARDGLAGPSVCILFHKKVRSGVSLEPGDVVRLHPPWQRSQAGSCGMEVVYNVLGCHNLHPLAQNNR